MFERMVRTVVLIALRPGRDASFEVALGGMGLSLPQMGRFTMAGGLMLVRAAPHQVLAMRKGADEPLMDELAPLGTEAGLIDLSDARVAVRVAGGDVRRRLSYLLPIDLDGLQPGSCATTMMAHLSVLVLQRDAQSYELQCGRSFEASFLRALDVVPA